RHRLLVQTTQVLRRRRRWRRIGSVAALVACYLLGLATMHLCIVVPSVTTETAIVLPHDHSPEEKALPRTPAIPGQASAALAVNDDADIPVFVLERMAQASEEHRSRLYRRAGDRYLADGDLKSAVHCYSRSLDADSRQDWAI